PALSSSYPPLASNFFFYCDGHNRDLHSFPTRRSSDLQAEGTQRATAKTGGHLGGRDTPAPVEVPAKTLSYEEFIAKRATRAELRDRKSTRLNSSHVKISYAVFCLKKKKKTRD